MVPVLAVAFVVIPIVELAVIVLAGENIGYPLTFGLILLFSIAGAVLTKREGVTVWRRFKAAIKRGETPSSEIADGFMVLLGGALLLTPGFVTDALGLSLLLPVSRGWMKRRVMASVKRRVAKRFPAAGAAARASRQRVAGSARPAKVVKVTTEPPSDQAGSDPAP